MNNLRMSSMDLIQQNIEKLKNLFPHCISEGKVDLSLLAQELSDSIIDGNQERYQLNWVGKRESILAANAPIAKTLRPMREESENFDETSNLFIEGDNLDALKLLQETYLGKVKMIYIDPPYNTGNDFVYKDDFAENRDDFLNRSNQTDEKGNRLVSNPESNGRFHSDWLSMIYPRLKLARNLLADDGVIFISIDDNEQANLKRVCDEIFGEQNFVTELIRKTKSTTNDAKTGLNLQHEVCLVFAKNKEQISLLGGEKDLERYSNPDNDPNGDWISDNPSAKSGTNENNYFAVINPYTGKQDFPPTGRYWLFSKNTIQKHIEYGTICFKKEHAENERGFIFKRYKKDLKTTKKTLDSLFFCDNSFMNQAATKELLAMGLSTYFSYPKGVQFIKKMIEHSSDKDSVILDFFAGSATTAHAVMQLNAEDNGNRKFIMVQLPEKTDEKSEAYKAGFATIAEISKERIRRAGKQIAEQNPNVDIGFRVLKIDSSNMADIFYTPQQLSQDDLFTNAVKNDRTAEDLLFQAMLDLGIALSSLIERREIQGRTVFNVAEQQLIACFDEIDENLITELAEIKPQQAVFLDTKFANDSVKINAVQIFRQMSASTVLSVI